MLTACIAALSLCTAIVLFVVLSSLLDDTPRAAVRARLDALAADKEMDSLHSEVLREKKKKKKRSTHLISKRFEDSLAMSGVKLSAQEYITIWVCTTFGPVVFGFLLGLDSIAVLGLSIIGFALPPIMVQQSKNKQRQLFNQQLGEALTIMSNCMRSGYSFQQAMGSIAQEMQPPISTEFARVVRELNYGVTLEDALNHMLSRVDNRDMELLVSAVLTSAEVGANLSEILDTISETVRDRIRLREEIRTFSAQGRMSGLIIGLLPIIVALFLMVINPTYITSFLETDIGKLMLGVSVCMEAMGFLVINKIVDIKY